MTFTESYKIGAQSLLFLFYRDMVELSGKNKSNIILLWARNSIIFMKNYKFYNTCLTVQSLCQIDVQVYWASTYQDEKERITTCYLDLIHFWFGAEESHNVTWFGEPKESHLLLKQKIVPTNKQTTPWGASRQFFWLHFAAHFCHDFYFK